MSGIFPVITAKTEFLVNVMLDKNSIMTILKQSYPYMTSEYGVKKIGLFGSYAKGRETEKSDIDLIAEFEKPIGLKFIEFTEYLDGLFDKKTDVLTPEGVKSIIVKDIADDIEGSVIYVWKD